MLPFTKILSPIDFSDPSHAALDMAAELASRFEAELWLVHIVPAIPKLPAASYAFKEREYEEELHRDAERRLAEMAQKLSQKGIKAKSTVGTANDAAMEIIRIGEHNGVDLDSDRHARNVGLAQARLRLGDRESGARSAMSGADFADAQSSRIALIAACDSKNPGTARPCTELRSPSPASCLRAAITMCYDGGLLRRRRKGSGDPPGLQSRRSGPSRVGWWVRLPHASAKFLSFIQFGAELTPFQSLTPIERLLSRFSPTAARKRLFQSHARYVRSDSGSFSSRSVASTESQR